MDCLLAAVGDADTVLPVPLALDAALPAARSAVCGFDAREAVAAGAFLARLGLGERRRWRRFDVDWSWQESKATDREEVGVRGTKTGDRTLWNSGTSGTGLTAAAPCLSAYFPACPSFADGKTVSEIRRGYGASVIIGLVVPPRASRNL